MHHVSEGDGSFLEHNVFAMITNIGKFSSGYVSMTRYSRSSYVIVEATNFKLESVNIKSVQIMLAF